MTRPAVVHGPAGSAAVAAGSVGAVDAAIEVLRAGGSSVDAVLAAAFATAVTEPVLSSLGGGGFLLHAPAGRDPELHDFFVTVPGLGGGSAVPDVRTVVVDFADAGPAAGASEQVFHGGWGTVAVPGCLAGYLDAHDRWGRLPLASVVGPGAALARGGVRLAPVQRRFVTLVADLLALTDESAAIFADLDAHGRYVNTGYADLLDSLGRGDITVHHDPSYADRLLACSEAGGGLLTDLDLRSYEPVLREPQLLDHSGVEVWTNPAPAAGGPIVLDALARLTATAGARTPIDWAAVAAAQADAVLAHRAPGQVPTGTTHISVVDAAGDFAALTTSNGSGSGSMLSGWGVSLNNMLGEEDLQPGEPLAPGVRMGSMMAPTLLAWPDGARVVLGTGGSERIRSATLAVLLRLIDTGAGLADAVAAPRVHVSSDHQVHVEPGLTAADLDGLRRVSAARDWPEIESWPRTNVFFGGVNAVRRNVAGVVVAVADGRRGGAAAVLAPDGGVRVAVSDQ